MLNLEYSTTDGNVIHIDSGMLRGDVEYDTIPYHTLMIQVHTIHHAHLSSPRLQCIDMHGLTTAYRTSR